MPEFREIQEHGGGPREIRGLAPGPTPALTGTAPAARCVDDVLFIDDGRPKDDYRGRVRGRMQRVGLATLFFTEAGSTTGLDVMGRNRLASCHDGASDL